MLYFFTFPTHTPVPCPLILLRHVGIIKKKKCYKTRRKDKRKLSRKQANEAASPHTGQHGLVRFSPLQRKSSVCPPRLRLPPFFSLFVLTCTFFPFFVPPGSFVVSLFFPLFATIFFPFPVAVGFLVVVCVCALLLLLLLTPLLPPLALVTVHYGGDVIFPLL